MAKAKKQVKRGKRYGVLNAPPLIIDFKLNMMSGCTTTYGVSYCGPVPKLDMDPKGIPVLLRALADKLEELQAGGSVPSFGEAFAAGMDAAAATKAHRATKH